MDNTIVDERRVEVESLIAGGEADLKRAFLRLMDFVKDFAGRGPLWNEVIILNRQITDHQNEERRLGESAETARKRNEILDHALILLNDVAVIASERASVPPLVSATPDRGSLTRSDEGKSAIPNPSEREVEPSDDQAVYRCQAMCRGYRRGRRFRLRDVVLILRPGEITGLVGPNASGKTTLLRIIAGELRPDEGQFAYPLLQPQANKPGQINWGLVRSQIAHVPQSPCRWFGRTINNLYRQAAFFGLRGADAVSEVEFSLERLDLSEYREARWNELSGGLRTRFELARALVSRPKLLVLDEPLGPLDPEMQLVFLRDLKDLASSVRRPLAVIISSQHLYETEAIADKLLFLKNGEPEFYGRRDDIGATRKENVFELMTSASAAELEQAFGSLITACEPRGQRMFFVRSPLSTQKRDLLAIVVQKQIDLQYFRDVSRSTRTWLGNNHERHEKPTN